MKLYFEDLEVGAVFRGDECVADKDEMLDYARKNDPSPFHVDEEAARNSPHGGLTASAGYTGTLWYRSGIPILASIAFLGGSNGISSFRYLFARATDCMPRWKFAIRSRLANRAGDTLRLSTESLIRSPRWCSHARLCGWSAPSHAEQADACLVGLPGR